MKFLCGSCRTKYQISDEKVRGKILTIRCKKCGAKILVRESLAREAGGGTAVAPVAEEHQERVSATEQTRAARVGGSVAVASALERTMTNSEVDDIPTSIAPVPANLEIAGVEWYVAIDGQQHGPYAFAEVVRKVASGDVVGRNYVWHDGMDEWTRVRDVKDLAKYLAPSSSSGVKSVPPPPPVDGAADPGPANVVDMAQKRAEWERRKSRLSDAPLDSDSELDQTTVEPHSIQGHDGDSTSRRAEELDEVLNEALGLAPVSSPAEEIEPEDETQAVPTPKPSKSTAFEGTAVGDDDDLSFDANKEDIFANVPRAFADEEVQRESTRFFVAAAGVNQQKSRNRFALVLGLLVILGLGSFVTAWAQGIVQLSLPGIGNPFSKDDEIAQEDEDDGPQDKTDAKRLRAQLVGNKKKRVKRPVRRNSEAPSVPGNYIEDETSGAGTTNRRSDGSDPKSVGIELGTSKTPGIVGISDAKLPSADPSIPEVETGTLDQQTIARVVRNRQKSVRICYQQSLKGQEDLRGKLEVMVIVQPAGHVSRAEVETLAFKGSRLGRCIEDKIRSWRFPRFQGDPKPIRVPFVFEQQRL